MSKDPIAIVQESIDIKQAASEIDDLLTRINEGAAALHRATKIVDDWRYQAGRLLAKVRKTIPASGPRAKAWGEFVSARGITNDTALNYMKLAEYADHDPSNLSRTVGDIYKELEIGIRRSTSANLVDNFASPKDCDPIKVATSQIPPPAFSFGPSGDLDPELEQLPSGLIVPRERTADFEQRRLLARLTPKEVEFLMVRLTSAQKQDQRELVERLAPPAKPGKAESYASILPGPAGAALAAPDDAPKPKPTELPKLQPGDLDQALGMGQGYEDEPDHTDDDDRDEIEDDDEIEEAPAPPPDTEISPAAWANLLARARGAGRDDAAEGSEPGSKIFACTDAHELWLRIGTNDDPDLSLTQKRKLLAAYQTAYQASGPLKLKPPPMNLDDAINQIAEALGCDTQLEPILGAIAELKSRSAANEVEQLRARVRELEAAALPAPRDTGNFPPGTPIVIASDRSEGNGRHGVVVGESSQSGWPMVFLYPCKGDKKGKVIATNEAWLLIDPDVERADAIARALASDRLSREQRRAMEALAAKGAAP